MTDNEKLVWAAIDAVRRWENLKKVAEGLPADQRPYVDVSRAYAEKPLAIEVVVERMNNSGEQPEKADEG